MRQDTAGPDPCPAPALSTDGLLQHGESSPPQSRSSGGPPLSHSHSHLPTLGPGTLCTADTPGFLPHLLSLVRFHRHTAGLNSDSDVSQLPLPGIQCKTSLSFSLQDISKDPSGLPSLTVWESSSQSRVDHSPARSELCGSQLEQNQANPNNNPANLLQPGPACTLGVLRPHLLSSSCCSYLHPQLCVRQSMGPPGVSTLLFP